MTYSLSPGADDVRAILAAYYRVVSASWPALHPEMSERSRHWGSATEQELKAELADYVAVSSRPESEIRLFWKIGPCLPRADFAGTADTVGISVHLSGLAVPVTSGASGTPAHCQSTGRGEAEFLDDVLGLLGRTRK